MKKIMIDGKDYTLKYSFRAARYKGCAELITNLMMRIDEASSKDDTKALIKEITDLPDQVTRLFYGGLLQFHGTHKKGDGSITSLEQVEDLLDTYMEENEDVTYFTLFTTIAECMTDDGFFNLFGLTGNQEQTEEKVGKRRGRKPKEALTN